VGGFGETAKSEEKIDESAEFPEQEAQIKHMFRKDEGHILDTPANRREILEIVKRENFRGTDGFGKRHYYKTNRNRRKQLWCQVLGGIIQNCGENTPPWTENEISSTLI
jgi:hypothetical protein